MKAIATIEVTDGALEMGEIRLFTPYIESPADYQCNPSGLLPLDDVRTIASCALLYGQVIGSIGGLCWRK